MILQTLTDFDQKIMECVKKRVDATTGTEREAADKFCDDTFRNGVSSINDETQRQAEKHTFQRMLDQGYSKDEIEKALDHTLKRIANLEKKVYPNAKEFSTWFVAKVAVALMFGGWLLTAVTGYHRPETESEKAIRRLQQDAAVRASQMDTLNRITLSPEDFNIMMGGIRAPMAPTPLPDAPVPEAAAAPIPVEVATVAAAPIEVDVETPTARQAFTSTVGQVYRNSPPPLQHAIEQHVIQHDYNNDNSAAFAEHLHEMSEAWSRNNFPSNNNQPNNIHVDAVDGNGTRFGSANFHQ